jgi:hypothetical protein
MPPKVTYASVLAVGEFRAMWLAEMASVAGDQVARVALAVLVYQRTSSAGLTGLTYALTYLPSLLGGVFLSSLADRYPRRNVMAATDVARGLLVALMAFPGAPLWLLCVLLTLVMTLHGPFKAAQLALLADVLTGERYVIALAIRHGSIQASQLVAFAGGGALVALVSPSTGLLLDAATFLVSALFVWYGVTHRPAPGATRLGPERERRTWRTSLHDAATGGFRLVWRDPSLRILLIMAWLAGFHITPEALAAPYADALGVGVFAVGLIMASDPAGSVLGAFVFTRWVPETTRVRLMGPLAVLAGLPLLLGFMVPPLPYSMFLFALSGAFAMAYHTQLGASFARALPGRGRAQGLGLMSTGLITVQGLGSLAAGWAADLVGPGMTVTLAGVAATAVAVPAAIGWERLTRPVPATAP